MNEKFNLNKILETWKNNQYTQSLTFFYLFIYLLMSAVAKALPGSGAGPWWASLLGAVIGFVIGYFLLNYLWNANGGDQGRQFMDKVLSIGTVYTVTRLIPVMLVLAIPLIILYFVRPDSIMIGTVIFGLGILLAFVFYLIKLKEKLSVIRDAELKKEGSIL